MGEGGCEKQTSQLHTCMEGKVIEIRNFFEWAGGNFVRDHQVVVVGLPAAVLTLGAAFFLNFPAAALGAAVVLG